MTVWASVKVIKRPKKALEMKSIYTGNFWVTLPVLDHWLPFYLYTQNYSAKCFALLNLIFFIHKVWHEFQWNSYRVSLLSWYFLKHMLIAAVSLRMQILTYLIYLFIHPEAEEALHQVFLGKGVLKICSKFTKEHPCQSVISKQLNWNRTSAGMFSCEFAAYFQNNFS